MVKIRLTRGGSKKRPMYRIVAVDSRAARETRVLEFLGTYQPLDGQLSIRESALEAWLARGAQTSPTVHSLLRKHRGTSDAEPVSDAAASPEAAPAAETAPAAESAEAPAGA